MNPLSWLCCFGVGDNEDSLVGRSLLLSHSGDYFLFLRGSLLGYGWRSPLRRPIAPWQRHHDPVSSRFSRNWPWLVLRVILYFIHLGGRLLWCAGAVTSGGFRVRVPGTATGAAEREGGLDSRAILSSPAQTPESTSGTASEGICRALMPGNWIADSRTPLSSSSPKTVFVSKPAVNIWMCLRVLLIIIYWKCRNRLVLFIDVSSALVFKNLFKGFIWLKRTYPYHVVESR